MSQLEFLQGILPEGARYSLRLIKKSTGFALNKFVELTDDVEQTIKSYIDSGYDVYYATAGFGAGSNATADNAVSKRELYVDVDCGSDKPFADKAQGMQALKNFCQQTKLPRPTIVDSGNGLHAHWIFIDPIPVHEWKALASKLKSLCQSNNFEVDPTCTADTVRVLRVPETINFKNRATVTLLTPIKYYDVKALRAVLGNVFIPSADLFARAKVLSQEGIAQTRKLMGDPNRTSKFETIWLKSAEGKGCAQIQNAIQNADTLPEPIWRGVLSVAQYCEDRDWAIHEISKNHPNYSAEETETKAAGTKGPYTCETFQGMETAALCADCPHSGKITSPIQLGATIKVAEPEDNEVVIDQVKYEIPSFPYPYFRGKGGGVYMHARKGEKKKKGDDDDDDDEDEKPKEELIYPNDLYVYKRSRDPDVGDCVWIRHHLPNDGVREFLLAQKDIGALDRFRDKLSEQGVTAFTAVQLQRLQALMSAFIRDFQGRERAEAMHSRFGWTKDRTFIVGSKEYTRAGVRHAPVAKHLEKYMPWFTPKGSLEEWKSVADAYNAPEFDLHALGVLAGFGSVLMALSPENGAVLAYYSKQSGTGKTTILKMVNSIFGDPKALMKDAQDTHLTKVHRMGMLNGIPVTLDEMTNTSPQEMSSLLYGSTQGRARDRMKANENAERTNDLVWKSMSVWSSNTSIEDRLGLIKSDPQGELARVIDIHLQTPVPFDVLEAQKLFNKLNDNYGHAGDVFLRYVIPNLDEVQEVWNQTRDMIYAKQAWTQAERYKLNAIVCIVAAGIITNAIGLTRYNIKRIARRSTELIAVSGAELRATATRAVETFASFINHNISNMLIVNSKARVNGLQDSPAAVPKGTLMIRYEPDTKDLFIVQRDFNRWCAEMFVNAKEMRELFKQETNQDLELIRKRMGAGWNADFGSVPAYWIRDAEKVLGFDYGSVATAARNAEV